MPDRPLIILPTPTEPPKKKKKGFPPQRPHLPSRERQAERLTPRFTVLQEAMDARRARLRTVSSGVIPEEVIVLETVGPVNDFIVAVRNVRGLEWLGEVEEEDIPPDDDFFIADSEGAPKAEKMLRGRLFLVLSNHQALQQMLSLWNSWKAGQELPWGFGKWSELFSQLRDIRPWGVRDEGGIKFAVYGKDGKVVIDFNSPVSWLATNPEQAIELGRVLIKHARKILRDETA